MQGYSRLSLIVIVASAILAARANDASAAVFDSDGGITLWISYDNLDATMNAENATGVLLAPAPDASRRLDHFFDHDALKTPVGAASCVNNKAARSTHDATAAIHSCPSTGCKGIEKFEADIKTLARYIYSITEGRHFLRRVYVSERVDGRVWETADIQWNVGNGGITNTTKSMATFNGWTYARSPVRMHGALRACGPDELLHELGHYLYWLADRYPGEHGACPLFVDTAGFRVDILETDEKYAEETVMSGMFPHRFSDSETAKVRVKYPTGNPPPFPVTEITLEADNASEGPYRNLGDCQLRRVAFGRDEWSQLQDEAITPHVDLVGTHATGSWPTVELPVEKKPDIQYVKAEHRQPGIIVLLDNSNSMNAPANDPASKYAQEFATFFYHSSDPPVEGASAVPGELSGTFLYNNEVKRWIGYEEFDPDEELQDLEFPTAVGSTKVTKALAAAIDTFDEAHPETGANSGTIFLVSDGDFAGDDALWEQVRRANQHGIKLSPVRYGEASSVVMDEIAAYSSTEKRSVFAPSHAQEMKLGLCREIATLRGNTAIHSFKGTVTDASAEGVCTATGAAGACQGELVVPPGTEDLLLYVFLRDGNAGELKLELIADGASASSTANANEPLPMKGRFNGIRVESPAAGMWTYTITGPLSSADQIEIVGYANHPELDAEVWLEQSEGADPTLKARLTHRYPLTHLPLVRYTAYDGEGRPLNSNAGMAENDEHRGGTERVRSDGVYAREIELSGSTFVPGQRVRFDVEFVTAFSSGATKPGENVRYSPSADHALVENDYNRFYPSASRKDFKAYATLVTTLGEPPRAAPTVKTYRLPRRFRRNQPGEASYLGATVKRAHPLLEQTRVSLGAGVDAKVISVRRRQRCHADRTVIGIRYEIDDAAQPGPRNLLLQFGGIIAKKNGAIEVEAP
jgi:hypothetical protein